MTTREIFFDIMLLVSCGVMTLGIVGIVRMPDVYTKLHGASKSVFLGVVMLCIASSLLATAEMNMRLGLIALLVVLTTPLSSHVIGRAGYLLHEQMETPGAVDESHTLVDDSGEPVGEDPGWRL
jgi:multicomponent Na+:H+ antiporter subunit G